jgi:ornithine cyclodeaminase
MRVEKDLQIEVEISRTDSLLRNCDLISLATNATVPHIPDLSMCLPEAVILHVSLRDIAPAAILAASNFVDDVDHVCRALTSVHLAEQLSGSRRFIQGTLGDLLLGKARVEHGTGRVKVFSPFGLGILDLAVGQFACTLGVEQNRAIEITSFLPEPWAQATEAPAHRSSR